MALGVAACLTRVRFLEILRQYLRSDIVLLNEQFRSCEMLREDPDWAWFVFVQSYATNGGVGRWEAFLRTEGRRRVRWDALFEGAPDDVYAAAGRLNALSQEFLAPRRAGRTRPALMATFQRFCEFGGPGVVAQTWNAHDEERSLLRWLRTFPMIGEKYSRNMCMDVAHPLVLDHIALDHRINALCNRVIGAPSSGSYDMRERWLYEVAVDLGINGWYLDRLLFLRYDKLKNAI